MVNILIIIWYFVCSNIYFWVCFIIKNILNEIKIIFNILLITKINNVFDELLSDGQLKIRDVLW